MEEAMPFKFDSLERIRKVSVPILMVHGKRDPVVPFHMSQQLQRAIRSPLTRLDLSSAGHHDIFAKGGERLWGKVFEFLESLPLTAENANPKDLAAQT